MPDLRAFADFARARGLSPVFPDGGNSVGNGPSKKLNQSNHILTEHVPHVPRVPRQNDAEAQKADWQALFDERAGIREFDGGLDRAEAERLAYADTVAVLGPKPGAR